MVDGTPSPDVVQAEIRRKLGLVNAEGEATAAGRAAGGTRGESPRPPTRRREA